MSKNNVHSIRTLIVSSIIASLFVPPVFAKTSVDTRVSATSSGKAEARAEVKMDLKVHREEVKEDVEELKDEWKDKREDLKETFKEKIASKVSELKNFIRRRAILVGAKVTEKGTNFLKVEKDGKTYTVEISDKTQLRRRFFGKSDLAEILVGHTVNVYGIWKDETHTTIVAKLIRDVSIQLRHGVFLGILKAINGNTWTLETKHRGTQTVTVSSDTTFVNRKQEAIAQGDVKVEHKIRVKGLWDRKNNTVTGVRQVKDYSLPPLPALRVTVTPSVTSTP